MFKQDLSWSWGLWSSASSCLLVALSCSATSMGIFFFGLLARWLNYYKVMLRSNASMSALYQLSAPSEDVPFQ